MNWDLLDQTHYLKPIRPQRKRKNPKNLTTSRMIDHMAMAVEDRKDVAMAAIIHLAMGTTMAKAVGINLI